MEGRLLVRYVSKRIATLAFNKMIWVEKLGGVDQAVLPPDGQPPDGVHQLLLLCGGGGAAVVDTDLQLVGAAGPELVLDVLGRGLGQG
jgi:hypothetical protein